MNKAYERINWKNYPSEETAVNESNLNRMDAALNEVDTRVVAHETTKLDVATANTMVRNVSFNERTGIFTVTYLNGSTKELDTKLEKIATNFVYDEERQKLIITLIDGTTQEIDMSALITQYEFENSAYISFTVVNGKVKSEIINGSITADKLQPNFLADVTLQANSAKTSEQNAKTSEENAKQSEINAKNYADSAEPVASTAQGLNPTLENSTGAPIITFDGKGATIQDGEPTPDNKVDIEGAGASGSLSVKSTGKNLFDINKRLVGIFNDDGDLVISNSTATFYEYAFKENTQYTLSAYTKNSESLGNVRLAVEYTDGIKNTTVFVNNTTTYKYMTFTSEVGKTIKRIAVHFGNSGSMSIKGGELQIEEGTTATDYEPYTETTADIPLSAPLYEGDYIRYNMDGSGEESHKIRSIVYDGSDDEWWELFSNNCFIMRMFAGNKDVAYTVISSHFTGMKTPTAWTALQDGECQNVDYTIGFKKNGINTVEEWRTWLQANPITVVYERAEPTVTPLTAEQIAEFEKLRTFDGVSHVTCEAESEIQYFCDSVSGKAVASVVSKVERELSDFDITLARTSITATSAFNKTKFDRSILSDFDYETGQVMSTGGDDLSVADALAHLEGAVIDIMNGVIANKAKIDALSS